MPSAEGAYGTTAVGATAVLLVPARFRREAVTIQNLHATQTLHIGSDASVTTANGIRIAAAGGSHTFEGYQGNLYAIASGAATPANWFERF